MASGQIFGLTACPPGQLYAVEDTIAATTTATGGPYEIIPVWTFDAATSAFMDFYTRFTGLGTGGVSLRVHFAASGTATLGVRLRAGLRVLDDSVAITTAHTYAYSSLDGFTLNTGYFVDSGSVAFTATDISTAGIGDGSAGLVRLYRDATATHDALTTNLYVLQGAMTLVET